MQMRFITLSLNLGAIAGACILFSPSIYADAGANDGQKAISPAYPSDNDSFNGDHIRLETNVDGFQPASGKADEKGKCAPAGSRLAVTRTENSDIFVHFFGVETEGSTLPAYDKSAFKACSGDTVVNTYTLYKISKSALGQSAFIRSGVVFGGLIIPFKYRFGSKELVSSVTFAPFIGFRTGWQPFGLTFTPVVAAGLSLVPVTDPSSQKSEPKAAFTMGGGVRLTSSKSDQYSAGLIFGRDNLNKSDRDADPSVSKNWVSVYLGYSTP